MNVPPPPCVSLDIDETRIVGTSVLARRPASPSRPLRRRLLACALAPLVARPAQAANRTLTVSAAASLTQVLRELAPDFEAAHPGLTLRLNVAASGVLLQQIRQGAPVDVFVSADEETMSRGIAERLLDGGTRRDVATNTVVLIMPAPGGPALSRLQDLTRPDIRRIAIGKPDTVPVGRYAKQALESAALWSTLQSRLVYGDSVRQVLDYVARGEVEAGIVYRTDAAMLSDRVRVATTLDGHAPVRYPAAVVTDSRQRKDAEAFVAFLTSAGAQRLFARHGFGTP